MGQMLNLNTVSGLLIPQIIPVRGFQAVDLKATLSEAPSVSLDLPRRLHMRQCQPIRCTIRDYEQDLQ
jgi:hypothetical protein